jgi:ABC-2 type transport system ATP-binding protein
LTKRYGEFTAVRELNMNIKAGEVYGFLGPNGAGKTTTLMMLLGIADPTSGEIELFGEHYTPRRLDLRKHIGVVPEKHPQSMWRWMTGGEYLRAFADLFEVEDADSRIAALLEQVELLEVRNRRIADYSRGMMQKLSIVRALLHDPDLLVLDEPISGLDPIGIKQVRDLVDAENRDGRTILISSHMLSEMEKLCHRVGIINRGTLVVEDTMSRIVSRLTGGREIRIELERYPEELASELEGLPYVLGITPQESGLVVKVPAEGDHRRDISQFFIQRDLVPLGIQEVSPSLEEAFVTITSENIDQIAQPEA